MRGLVLSCLFSTTLVSCGSNPSSSVPAALEESATAGNSEGVADGNGVADLNLTARAGFSLAAPEAIYCPPGTKYLKEARVCANATEAIGPFTPAMISKCKKWGGGNETCESSRWGLEFAREIRGTEKCPMGTEFDTSVQGCVVGNFAFGPFSQSAVDTCKKSKGGETCDEMRWPRSLLQKSVTTTSDKLVSYYKNPTNYKKVHADVMSWYGTTTNACVAFMSTALRHIGVPVPRDTMDGPYRISLVTVPFSKYLEKNLGWTRITDAGKLLPGDVVFTEDAPSWPGVPAHTYMFQAWKDKARGIGLVVDNQANTHERNIFGYGTFNFTPFEYAMRAPK